MASTSNTRMHPQPEESAPTTSASAGSSMPAFVQYKPPSTKLAVESNKSYHVFLSFRGPDVRKTLVDHLYVALSAAGLNVFLDSHKLKKGEMIELSLETAMESSAIRIPIFSEGYAGSAWCLKEAAAMLSTPGLIIPLFYQVEPTDVRYPENDSSPYKQSFLKHYGHPGRYRREEIDGWKKALLEICKRSGWSLDITGGSVAWLVKMMVNYVLSTLDSLRDPLEGGMDDVKNAVVQKLNLSLEEEVVKVVIWGMRCIGKLSVAKAVYDQFCADFEVSSFIFNVRATAADPTGLPKLQTQILKDLIGYDGEVQSVEQGKSLFRDHLAGKRVLLVLEDVESVVQLDALGGDWLFPGSRVIITSTDKHIFNVVRVSSERIHVKDKFFVIGKFPTPNT